jgi:apolipoprotein D and lipocalin family protein
MKTPVGYTAKADYDIIEVDPDYTWAIVGMPNRKGYWLLARNKTVSQSIEDHFYERGRSLGFDTS